MKRPSLRLDDPLDETLRNILLHELKRMGRREKAVVEAADVEALHQMRVSGRRILAACEVFRPLLKKSSKDFLNFIRRAGRALGRMRDAQILAENLRVFSSGLPRADNADYEEGTEFIEELLREERSRLLAYLRSPVYRGAYAAFLSELEAGIPRWFRGRRSGRPAERARYVFPGLILQSYGGVMSFRGRIDAAEVSPEIFHALRIDTKVFRYTMEFADSAAGGVFRSVLRTAAGLQNRLGELQDSLTAAERIRDFREKAPAGFLQSPLITAYLTEKQRSIGVLVKKISPQWRRITAESYKKALFDALGRL